MSIIIIINFVSIVKALMIIGSLEV